MKKFIATLLALCLFLPCLTVSTEGAEVTKIECESMRLSGQYAGTISEPFSGAGFYANGDTAAASAVFPEGNAYYRLTVRGASSAEGSPAGISVYIDGAKRMAVTFSSKTPSERSFEFTVYEAKTSELKLVLETDNGSNDTYIDYVTIEKTGAIPSPPKLPDKGAAVTGSYRNMFAEMGIPDRDIQQKLDDAFNQLFYGTDGADKINDGKRVYYPVGNDMAYILDTGNNDVRSEGMSYGMMISVQMNKKEEFNRLWKWAKTYMYHPEGERKGMFAWQCQTTGDVKDANTASDGEEYIAAALLFASARWGDGSGIYNYRKEALDLLSYMLYTNDRPGYELKTIIDPNRKMVVFTPYGSAADYTDPSYHLPAFYEVFARETDNETDKQIWFEVAKNSREFFKKCTHAKTGLAPDYANFDGSTGPGGGSHDYYSFDAWRVPMNIAMDYAWWKADEWQNTYAKRVQSFFHSEGMGVYGDNYELNGTRKYNADHSIGAVGCNAVASLAADTSEAWEFVKELWDSPIPEGKWRYYNGLLYMLSLLNVSGNYKAYLSGNTEATPTPSPTVKPTPTPTIKPTPTPTIKPTATPTLKPTSTPTIKPTSVPTLKPTSTPTEPTSTPTTEPDPEDTPTAAPENTPAVTPDNTGKILYEGMTKTTDGNTINTEIRILNSYQYDRTVCRIAACYKDGVVENVQIYSDVLKAESVTTVRGSIVNDGYDSVRIFCWDSMGGMRPLFGSIPVI